MSNSNSIKLTATNKGIYLGNEKEEKIIPYSEIIQVSRESNKVFIFLNTNIRTDDLKETFELEYDLEDNAKQAFNIIKEKML